MSDVDINGMTRGNILALNNTAHYHAQLEIRDNGRAIKSLDVCFVAWLESMKRMGS